jgi:hypothetical protein
MQKDLSFQTKNMQSSIHLSDWVKYFAGVASGVSRKSD